MNPKTKVMVNSNNNLKYDNLINGYENDNQTEKMEEIVQQSDQRKLEYFTE